jgi:hypothetical protein
VSKTVWSDEATYKLNGTVNHNNFVYLAPENPIIHMDKAVNLPGPTVWCGLSYRGLTGLFLYEKTVTGPTYLNMLWTSILPAIHPLYANEPFSFK